MAWLSGWTKRKEITLTGGASGAQTDFQLDLAVTYAGAMLSDFDDLRFTQSNGTTLVDAWLEVKVDDTSATVWVEFPTTPANTVEQTYYMYYGKADAVSDWNGDATFLLFDDFPGSSLDGNKWTVESGTGTWTVANNIASVSGTSNLSLVMTYDGNIIVEGFIQRNTESGVAEVAIGSQKTSVNIRLLNGDKSEIRDNAGARNTVSFPHSINTWYKIKYQKVGTVVSAWIDDVLKHSGITVTPTGTAIGYFHTHASAGKYKELRIRKYAANPPTYEFGAEESAPTGGNPMWYYNLLRRRNS